MATTANALDKQPWFADNISESKDRMQVSFERLPQKLLSPIAKVFRAPLTSLAIVENRRRLLAPEQQGKRVLIRMRVDAYGVYGGSQRYATLHRTGCVVSCKDAKQAEAALVSIIRMCMSLDGLELDNPQLTMERL